MAYVMANTTSNSSQGPMMDRLTHAVIKETSKNLKYYIDVQHRENAFVVNPNSSLMDSTSLRARFLYGRTKQTPSANALHPNDPNFRHILPNFQRRRFYSPAMSPETQMCREELNFHMRAFQFSPRSQSKLIDRRVGLPYRSSSSFSARRPTRPRSALKLPRYEQEQLVDDAACLLANMVKTRHNIQESHSPISPSPLMYISRSVNPSPRFLNELTNLRSTQTSAPQTSLNFRPLVLSQTSNDPKNNSERVSPTSLPKLSSVKLIKKGFLCQYKVSVTTGNCNGASTDAPIRMKFYGMNGCTNFHELIESETHRIPFIKDQLDRFTIQTYHVGQLIGVTIGHDRQDMRSSWYLKCISIEDPVTDTIYDIECNSWLSSKSNDLKTMRDFYVTSTTSHHEKTETDEHHDDNRSQSDYSTTVTEGGVTLNKTNLGDEEFLSDAQRMKTRRKQQHVSIGPTTIAKKSSLITANSPNLSNVRSSPITIEAHFNPREFTPNVIPLGRFHSPILSSTSSDTELKGSIINGTDSTTPTPTLNPIGLQSISEHGRIRQRSGNVSFKRPSTEYERDRPPARLDQRNSFISTSSERVSKSKGKKK